MAKYMNSVLAFAAGNTDLFDMYSDLWNHYRSENGTKKYAFATVDKKGNPVTYAQKEAELNAAIIRKISELSGFDLNGSMSIEMAATNPMVAWAATNLASQLIDAVLPDTIIDSVSPYCEVRTTGLGETAVFDINSRDLFKVSKAGRLGMRTAETQKGTQGQVTINAEARQITVGVSLLRVLMGLESIASFTVKAMRSLETEINKDVYVAMATAMAALSTTATTGLRLTGYSQIEMKKLAQRVSSHMGGAQPILIGTAAALSYIIPDDANYRMDVSSDYIKIGYLRQISGITTLELPQVADWGNPFATYLYDDRVWIVAPGQDKLVKLVISGNTVSHMSGTFDSATMTQDATFTKMWKAAVCTSSIGGQITVA